ncbi:MAG: helix-turn-helix transcriptional regulator [Thermostichales cyanobacterium DRC_bins_46]
MTRKASVTPRINTHTGRLLVQRMNDLHLTWIELSRRSELSGEGIKLICAGRHSPTLDHVTKLAQVLEIHPSQLMAAIYADKEKKDHVPEPEIPFEEMIQEISRRKNVSELLMIQEKITKRIQELTEPAPANPGTAQ